MRKHSIDDQHGGPDGTVPVSAATLEDLALAVRLLGEAEASRAKAVAALARVHARGDGEAAVGMPVTQHLRWNTNVRRGTVTTIGTITDVAGELPSVCAALEAGQITLDQAGAIAWPAASVSRDLRRSLDFSLTSDPGWTGWSPEFLQAETSRLLEDLQPARTERQEREAAERQWLNVQPTLDGQGLRGHFQAHGVDAAFINATLDAAADRPEATEDDPDGVLIGRPTRRGNQLFQGLLRIFRHFTCNGDDNDVPDVTLHVIVDETSEGTGSGELLTSRRGLAPRLTAKAVQALRDAGGREVTVFAVDREIVRVKGRAGHVFEDPESLSEDSTRVICRVRDRTCRMPGCDRPAEHLHHLVWRGLAKARGEVSPDHPMHRAWLCQPCHKFVHRWAWAGTVGTVGRITWSRAGPRQPNGSGRTRTRTTTSTLGATRATPPPTARRSRPDPPRPVRRPVAVLNELATRNQA